MSEVEYPNIGVKMKKSKVKTKLNKKLKPAIANAKKAVLKHKDAIAATTLAAAIAAAIAAIAVKAPELRDAWLRNKVGSKSYIMFEPGIGSGTGFMVKAPSGKSYLLTNDHVCDASTDGAHLSVMDDNGEFIPRSILHRSEKTDLCLLEGMPGVEGLTVSTSPPDKGDSLAAVGHPAGYLTTMTKGTLIMSKDIEIPEGYISIKMGSAPEELIPQELGGMLESECDKPKNKVLVQKRDFLGLEYVVKVCMNVTKNAYFTTILAQPGSSGSAVVNGWGQVIGVLFAGDSFGWSMLVSQEDMQDFLKKY